MSDVSTKVKKIVADHLGVEEEKVINEASNKMPVIKITTPIISITLFTPKFNALLANIFNFIN